jgi:hypothetical protein
MKFDPNISPCRQCPKNAENSMAADESVKGCIPQCVELACWQKARTIAEISGRLPLPGHCAICGYPGPDVFCNLCRARESEKISRRAALPPPPKNNFGPKQKKLNNYKWVYGKKQKTAAICHLCEESVEPGNPVLWRRCAPSKGNYQYVHPECLEDKANGVAA